MNQFGSNSLGTFAVVQKDRQIQEIPENWIIKKSDRDGESVVWPNSSLLKLIKDPHSIPVLFGPEKWCEHGKYEVKYRGLSSQSEATKIANYLEEHSDFEDGSALARKMRSTNRLFQKSNTQIPTFDLMPCKQSPKTKDLQSMSISLREDTNDEEHFDFSQNVSHTETTSRLEITQQANEISEAANLYTPVCVLSDQDFSNLQKISSEIIYEDFPSVNGYLNAAKIGKKESSEAYTEVNNISTSLAQILKNQEQLLVHMIDIKKSIRVLENEFEKIQLQETTHAKTQTSFKEPLAPFELIKSEDELKNFEDKIQNDPQFKNAAIAYLLGAVGNQANKGKSAQDCAFLFDPLIFENKFWTLTAWTGGRNLKSSGPCHENQRKLKFHFSKHIVFRNFLSTLIYNVLDVMISTEEMKKYVQSKTKNAFYEPKTDRMCTTRVAKPKALKY